MMNKILLFFKRKATLVFLFFLMLFSINAFAQTTLVEYNFNDSSTWNTPNTLDGGILSTPTLKYWRPNGGTRTELTPGFQGGNLIAAQENDYIELTINTIGYSSLNLSFDLKLLGAGLVAGGSLDVAYNRGGDWINNGEVSGATWFLDQVDDQTYNQPLPGDFSAVNPLLIRITATDWNVFGSASLQLDNLKITYGNPNITLYSDSNILIPDTAAANESYNTVFGNLQTLLEPGESKTYRIRNFNGNSGSVLNVSSIQIEPASGTTADDFIVQSTNNITGLTRVTSSTNNSSSSSNPFGTLTIKFVPQGEGVRSAIIKVYSNGAPSPYSFTVIGGGRNCNVSNTAYVQNTMDPAVIQTLPSDLQTGDYVTGDNKNHSNILGGTTNVIYPTPTSGTYPLNTTVPQGSKSSWFTGGNTNIKTGEFGGSSGIDISNLRNVSVEFNVAAFASNSSNGVKSSDYITLSVSDTNGNYVEVMQLNGSNNTTVRQYQFNPTGRVFTKNYSPTLTIESNNSSSTTTATGSTYARSRFKLNIPLSVSKDLVNFKFRIKAKANADAVWLIDDVRITSDNAVFKTWNGTAWSPAGRPGTKEKAVFDGKYDFNASGEAATLTVCECEVKAGKNVSIPANKTLTVQGNVINHGDGTNFIINDGGNLIQNENAAINTGKITVQKVFIFSTGRKQYNYVSSPTVDTNVKSIYTGNLDNAVSALYYIESNDYFGASAGTYIKGRGLALQESGGKGVVSVNAKFVGVPFNGIINYPLAFTNAAHGYNLVGNPYPSNLDIQKLYDANAAKIGATFYFWDNRANEKHTQDGSGYNGDSYAQYNAVSGTGVGSGTKAPLILDDKKIPNRYVKVGTGFLVQATSTGQTLDFNNTMRSPDNSGPGFFGKSNEAEKDRYWLMLKTPTDMELMNAVVYIPKGLKAFGIEDTETFGGSDDIYSIVDHYNLAIQGRDSFQDSDKIDIGLSLFQSGMHTISIYKKEGVFNNGQSVYLKDKQTGIITNLSKNYYTFTADGGENTGRFEIIYKPETMLATDGKVKENVIVYRESNDFVVKAQNKKITALTLFDGAGRLIFSLKTNALKVTVPASQLVNGVYILKIDQSGEITTKKVMR